MRLLSNLACLIFTRTSYSWSSRLITGLTALVVGTEPLGLTLGAGDELAQAEHSVVEDGGQWHGHH